MTEDRSQLINFVQKFLGTVKFGNDHVAKIMGYGDYQIGNVTISQASKTKSWIWHRRLSRLNFGAINHLARQGLVRGLSKLKFEKDHLCSACAMGKSTKKTHKPKSKDTNQEKLYLLHMDLCGPMPRTMLIYAQAPLFLWAEAVETACFTQNRSIILAMERLRMSLCTVNSLIYHFFHVFGALCYPTNDSENVGKLQPKADIGIFIGYAPTKKAFCIYNRHTRRIVETIHVDFYELTAMASEQSRIATATIVPPREPIPIVKSTDKPVVTLVIQIILWYLDSGCSKHMTGDRSKLINFIQKFLGMVTFRNDHVAKIMGYGDYQ
nr:integrase, catalytic region, zinc finger, CCHC-type, peptidase aspartic, catalytic [Tanacetum cinerariifolium]